MKLYRTCGKKNQSSPSLKFIKKGRSTLVSKFLKAEAMVNEVFSRQLPIPKIGESRFTPVGFNKNALYASESEETTYYEYGYHFLKGNFKNIEVRIATYELYLQSTHKPIDVSTEKDALEILDASSYNGAHKWLKSKDLKGVEVIKYPNVRAPHPDIFNYAIFQKKCIQTQDHTPKELTIVTRDNVKIEIYKTDGSQLVTIIPKMM